MKTKAATTVMSVALVASLAACGGGSSHNGVGPPIKFPSVSTTPPTPHVVADKKPVQRWLRHGRERIAMIVAAETKAVSAAKRNDPYAEVTICQPLQEALERAQEGERIPDKALDQDYQRAMATLAIGTTHCLNDAHSSDTPDMLATIKFGNQGLGQFAVLARALRPYK